MTEFNRFAAHLEPITINLPSLDLDEGVRAVWEQVVDYLVEEP